jgi:hypothetical protein
MFSFFKNRKARKEARKILSAEAMEEMGWSLMMMRSDSFDPRTDPELIKKSLAIAERKLISAKITPRECMNIYHTFGPEKKDRNEYQSLHLLNDFKQKILEIAAK